MNSACINCDTCRQLPPKTFRAVRGYSAVTQQPSTEAERRHACHALTTCPTAAIVSESKEDLAATTADFPLLMEENVYYCGFTSANRTAAAVYFINRPGRGNWLVDSPRWVPSLVRKMEELGGIDTIFLTYRDDVADAALYAERFGAKRIIHEAELSAQPESEHVIRGQEPVEWMDEFRIIPVPGHTRGHLVLLYRSKFLFTGDHLEWNRDRRERGAYKDYCWYSWT
ncbi:MBL fold metallo-hydrolase [Paenibacillus sp. LPE1-1-1.1]|uniref:MBL fold metallo-hydrolase n=1 Tax=Paenibacillus sp. LPE1-1-1.1 TaxID=3135230 RepID=UPI00343F9C7D